MGGHRLNCARRRGPFAVTLHATLPDGFDLVTVVEASEANDALRRRLTTSIGI
jgi:hypothetical protein